MKVSLIKTIFSAAIICCLWSILPSRARTEDSFTLIKAPESAGQYQRWELDFQVPGVSPHSLNEGVEAIIHPPSGPPQRIAAFYYQPYRLSYDTRKMVALSKDIQLPQERVIPLKDSVPHWRIRYAPSLPGLYHVEVVKREERLWRGNFTATPRQDKGFLRHTTRDGRYLAFDDGSGYFANGFNVCWPPPGTGVRGYRHFLKRLSDAGCNYTRLWLCTWGFNLDTPIPGRIDLGAAWQLDQVFTDAEKLGIRIKLCLFNFHDFKENPEKGPWFAPNGPCKQPEDFFTNAKARAISRHRLGSLVARYGAFTSLYAWELWNEMNYSLDSYSVDSDSLQETHFLPWTREMAGALRRMDPFRHPITTSLGLHKIWPDLWKMPEMEIVQQHSYLHYLSDYRLESEGDATAFLHNAGKRFNAHKKPFLMAEFGYVGTNEYNPLNRQDRSGIALHNSLWAGALLGHSGTPMHWWWDNYIEPNNLFTHYRALANFLKGVDWSLPKRPLICETDREVRVLVLMDRRWAGVWLQNLRATWSAMLERGLRPRRQGDVILNLNGFTPGKYRVEWFDTRKGTVTATQELTAGPKRLRLVVPPFLSDIAARLFLQSGAENRYKDK